MTPFALFEQWCTLVERLACQVQTLEASTQQDALEALMDSRPTTIPEDTARPCPHCGEGTCEASCTAALVAQAGLPSCAGWRQTPAAG